MREATQTVPVVFALVGDPVGNGFVANPARPGGNATGFQNFEPAVAEKWLTLLQEIAPGLRCAGIVYNRRVMANSPEISLPKRCWPRLQSCSTEGRPKIKCEKVLISSVLPLRFPVIVYTWYTLGLGGGPAVIEYFAICFAFFTVLGLTLMH